jgi:Heterokaryon incompatibility protein (HET)
MTNLSLTFRDAFKATRKLGIRYLWIDSLCIVQDSDFDWRAESSVIGKIYGHSLCNIAATGSSQTYGGLFQERSISELAPKTTSIRFKGKDATCCFTENQMWCAEISNARLNNRGWVLQERVLSPRTLHYTSQLFWECQTIEACETCPSGIPNRLCQGGCFALELHPLTLKSWRDKSSSDLWDQIIQSYTRCELTRASDCLVAIVGIAMEVQSLWRDQYLAVLWKRELPRCILWYFTNISGSLERTEQYRCNSSISGIEMARGFDHN